MASRRLEDLIPSMKNAALELKKRAAQAGIDIMFTCTARYWEEQVALFAQGRKSLVEVNKLRLFANLPPIAEADNAYCVTWTMNSKHIVNRTDNDPFNDLAKAFDIVVLTSGKPVWNLKVNVNKNEIPDYEEVARIGESIGLVAGARFKNRDYPHFEAPTNTEILKKLEEMYV